MGAALDPPRAVPLGPRKPYPHKESVMNIRFVTKTVHTFLDYPVALSLVTTPFLLGLGRGNPLAPM